MIEKYFTQIIVIKEKNSSKNSIGSKVESWVEKSVVKGLINPLQGDERLTSDKKTLYATHKLYCGITKIIEKDRIYCDDVEYEVKFVRNPMYMSRFLEVDLELIR